MSGGGAKQKRESTFGHKQQGGDCRGRDEGEVDGGGRKYKGWINGAGENRI